MVYTEAGEDLIASAPSGYAANLEKATSSLAPRRRSGPHRRRPARAGPHPRQGLHRRHLRLPSTFTASQDIKCVAFMGTTSTPIRGRRSPAPHRRLPPRRSHRQRDQAQRHRRHRRSAPHDCLKSLPSTSAAPQAILGPVGIPEVMTQGSLNGPQLRQTYRQAQRRLPGAIQAKASRPSSSMDLGLEGRKNLVGGANQLDYHFRNVTPGRDYTPTLIADIRNIVEGELDPIGTANPSASAKPSRSATSSSSARSIHNLHARHRARPRRQRSHPNHGQLRHRRRAHSHRRDRNQRSRVRQANPTSCPQASPLSRSSSPSPTSKNPPWSKPPKSPRHRPHHRRP